MKKIQLPLLFTMLISLATSNYANAQIQIGADIDGEVSGDQSGYSVSMPDAYTLAIGSPFNNNGLGNYAGQVRVYRLIGSTWQQKGADIEGGINGIKLGYSVTMPDSNTIAIGASYANGIVKVYSWNGTDWIQKGVNIDGLTVNDQSGWSVSMPDANTVAIGAPYSPGVVGTESGQVRVFSWNGGAWIQKGLDINGAMIGDRLGHSVSMTNANTLAIGAPRSDQNGTDAGLVKVYSWNGNSWQQQGSDIDGVTAGDYCGFSVTMPDSNTLALSSIYNDSTGNNAGQVRVFAWNGLGWQQKGNAMNGVAAGDQSGRSVFMPNSTTVAIGAPYNDVAGSSSGQVRIYSWNGTIWNQKGADIYGEAMFDQSGNAVCMPDANTVAVGAAFNQGNGSDAGHVRVYTICSPIYNSISVSACNSYLSPSTKYTWNSSAVYTDTIPNSVGCDSILTINLTINQSTSSTISVSACNSYLSPSTKYSWNSSAVYSDTIPNANGCDSIITINLTINQSTSSTISVSACNSYLSPSTLYTWDSSAVYMDTIPNAIGCDSIITINLTINTVDVSVMNSSPMLSANASGAKYQWLDCSTNFAVLSNDTNQVYTATVNGNYAVEITQNGCIDTSACETVGNISIQKNSFTSKLTVYPNPTAGNLSIDLGAEYKGIQVTFKNALGQEISTQSFASASLLPLQINGTKGIYFIEIKTANHTALIKVIKE